MLHSRLLVIWLMCSSHMFMDSRDPHSDLFRESIKFLIQQTSFNNYNFLTDLMPLYSSIEQGNRDSFPLTAEGNALSLNI